MIPLSLKLSNFTSYGTDVPILDFTPFKMAAISGQNGAGKSSLLDSITWCLWGSSRLGDNADQLVRLGAFEMSVELTFALDDHQFRVFRKRLLKSGGSTTLEFHSGSHGSPQVHNLTEGTIKATQQKIIETLHLTFETFVNSAFLRQGHADEFTTKGATERKKILADILGLGSFDLLEEKAKEKTKEAITKIQILEMQLLEIEAELSQKEENQKVLTLAELESKEAVSKLADLEKLIKTIATEREVIVLQKKALEEKAERLKKARQELAELKIQISLKEEAKQKNEQILSQKQEIAKKYQKLIQLGEERKKLEEKRSELIKVKDELSNLQKEVMALEDRRNKKITELEVLIKQFETENAQIQKEIDHLKTHKDSCPTCKQAINEEKNKQIQAENQAKIAKNIGELSKLQELLIKCKTTLLPQTKEIRDKEASVKNLEAETKDYLPIVSEINSLKQYEDLNIKLQQAESSLKTYLEAVSDLQKIYTQKEQQIAEENQQIEGLDLFTAKLLEVEDKLQAQETIKKELTEKLMEAQSRHGAAKQLVDKVTMLEERFSEKTKEKDKLKEAKEAFEELSLAFGKKGIQAMIIETAIPEIEDEANRLLDKLTESRMKVSFATQKETKAGQLQETLDIIISDEMGERPYEAYSGGEQFRINFAIRLALSKLLTHRAGSKLQFLVIDEGFGTQDAQGRTRIIEALDAIKDDFEKILIITHLDELKEEFPARIEVLKGPSGSTFQIVS